MNRKIKIGNGGTVTITDNDYVAAGGEAAIYANGSMAYKLYHDPVNKQIPPKKIQELGLIKNQQVITPKEIIFDCKNGSPIGYTTKFVTNVEPLLKLFTRAFKTDNNIDYQMINNLVKDMQLVVTDIHAAQCLVVDLNELNVLVDVSNGAKLIPWFIDTDSYSTPSFKATAIMDSIRDRKVSIIDKNGTIHYNPNIESDWYSWSILAFWLYSNIHPYRGAHDSYKPKDKKKQMDDGISVFHPGVRVPISVNDFKVIPPRHLDWFKRVFLNGERGIPPLADSNVPLLVPTQVITIQGTDKIGVDEIASYSDTILAIKNIMGIYYVATKTKIYAGTKEIGKNCHRRVGLCATGDGSLVVVKQGNTSEITFVDLTKADPIGKAVGNEFFIRNDCVYTSSTGKLIEHSFKSFSGKIMHVITQVANVSSSSSKVYDGCVIQDLLGKWFLTLPYKQGACFTKPIPEIDGYRVVGAKADKNVIVILGEKAGKYDRFILIYDKAFSSYTIRKVEDVTYDTINFAVMANGVCLLLASPAELELFATNSKVEILSNPPVDSTMKLFTNIDGVFFINGNSFHQIKRK